LDLTHQLDAKRQTLQTTKKLLTMGTNEPSTNFRKTSGRLRP